MKKKKMRITQEILDIAIAPKNSNKDNRNPLDILIKEEELRKKIMKQIIKKAGGTT